MKNLVSIFNDTERLCKTDHELIEAIENTIKNQYLVISDSDIKLCGDKHRFDTPAEITVSQKRSFEAASGYKGERVCVLNFASATHVGGGVRTGASAQEECLCRCSTLYFALDDKNISDNFHARHRRLIREGKMNFTYNDDSVFSPDIVVIKSDTKYPEPLPENERYRVDVITCAAPNLNVLYGKGFIGRDAVKELHILRAKRILNIAKSENEDVLILGAFGCGAFRNPPEVVAQAWAEVVKNYIYDFRAIEFAVYCPPDRPSKNYMAFLDTMQKFF